LTLWSRRWLSALFVVLALTVLLVSSNGMLTTRLIQSLEWRNIPPGELPKAEAIVVLGGATKSQVPPRPSVDLSEAGDRVLYAAQLYREERAPLIILSGGRITWKGGGPSESTDMATLLRTMGIPKSAIVEDPTSLNTYENAVNVKKILQERKIQQVLLVTSAMHMPRSLLIFQKQGINVIPAPTDFLVSEQDVSEPTATTEAKILNILPDSSRLDQTTRALKEYLGIVIYRLRGWL
jgi:uncharacterized SAM-binding protein YcdF (DUF218 family)